MGNVTRPMNEHQGDRPVHRADRTAMGRFLRIIKERSKNSGAKAEEPKAPMSKMGDTSYTPMSDDRYNSSSPQMGLGSENKAAWRRRSREVEPWVL